MVSGGFRLDLLLETARLARSTYYYQLKQLEDTTKIKRLKAKFKKFIMSIKEIMAISE
ncbi:hypothetical protein IQ7_00090 [Streptococcus thermophilus MTCC 5461]|nr:hypothetical protein IQ7_00090 [Streptococcus thermophilus MTCC 5461]